MQSSTFHKSAPYVLLIVTLCSGAALLHKAGKERHFSAWSEDWHMSCAIAASHVPKQRWLKFTQPPYEYKGKFLQNFGSCKATKILPTIWHVRGVIHSTAMQQHDIAPIVFETLLLENTDPREPGVRAYGAIYDSCSGLVDGHKYYPEYPPRKCGEALRIDFFKKVHGI